MEKQQQQTVTTPAIAATVETLRELLAQEYGPDYSFVVLARGEIIGASNRRHGIIVAQVTT